MWIKNIARESAVLKDAQIEVIRNPIPKNFQIEVRSTLRSKMQVKEGEKIITFIAADLSNPNKGLQYLLNAFMRCNVEAVKNCIIFLIGNIDDISVPKNLKYLKFMNRNEKQIEEFMAVTDLLVVPSILDNSPNVVGEALMAGTQVIGSRTGGITEMLEAFHMETFPVGSVDTLTSLIEKMEWNYDRKEIQVNASKMLSYESIAKKYISAYK
jgi:glycosyltransferase involved in cell wall biosynthesis